MIITLINRQVLENCRINQINIRRHYYLNFFLHDTVVINVFQDGPCFPVMKLVWINASCIQRETRATEPYVWKKLSVLRKIIIAKLDTKVCGRVLWSCYEDIRELNIRGQRRQRKRRWKSEFAFFQSSSRLLQVTNSVKCRRTLLKSNS